ncbi:hypothetical protein GTZ93_35315 [Corallococcus exiguus]|uniref:Uncharacterized protein n=2 Tax=Corallococcus exiguus TaxID=83462 RepID=A0A7X4YIJ0_9BACT|nr:hypothetical protein [Corallococcus exiguus]NBC45082.1 hypothetical protein [Corallococcus exiguus]
MSSNWLCLSLMSLGLSGCDTGPHTRLLFALNPSFLQGDSLSVPASGVRAMTDPVTLPDLTSDDGLRFQLAGAGVTVKDIRLELGGGLRCEDVSEELQEGTGCVSSEDGPDTVTLAGPFSFFLPDGEPSEGWKEPRIPTGKYRRVDFVLGEGGLRAYPRLQQGSIDLAMNLTLPEGTALGFEVPYPLTVAEGGSLRVTFRQATWLKGLPLRACFQSGDLPRTDSELLLDAASGECQGAGDRVREALRTQVGLSALPF